MSKSTVLVTGAFGQVGWRTAEIMLQRGYRVVATDLPTEASRTVAAAVSAEAGLEWPRKPDKARSKTSATARVAANEFLKDIRSRYRWL